MAQLDVLIADYQDAFDEETRKEQARRLRGIAADANALADQWDPPAPDGMLTFDQLNIGASVKIGGEWGTVQSKVPTDTGSELMLGFEDGHTSWYPVSEGETFLTEQPF